MKNPSIIFCAKHRVNFVMFEPVYRLLRRLPGLELGLSSGRYRRRPLIGWIDPKDPDAVNEKIFGEFDLDASHLIKTSRRDQRPYDVFVSSNASALIQPPNSRVSVQIFHGVSFRNFAVNPDYKRFDKLFFPGRYMMEQYIERGLLEPDDPRIELMGMPKLDRLVNGAYARDEIIGQLGLDPARPTVLWCPTGARHNSFEQLGHEGCRAIEASGCNLILKLHDHPHLPHGVSREALIERARAGLGERGRLAVGSDVTPLMAAADLLVSDASSVAYEFCLLDRPIIFIDAPDLIGERAAMEGSAMDTDTHGRKVGRIVKGAEDLSRVIGEELDDPGRLSAQRKAAAAHIFHEPGSAADRMARRLCELAGYDRAPHPSAP